jgi:hypothetical protein
MTNSGSDSEIQAIRDQLDQNANATTALRESVDGLSISTEALAEVQREQAELRRTAKAAEETAAEAKKLGDSRNLTANRRWRRFIVGTALAVAALLAVIGVAAVVVATRANSHAVQLNQEQDASRYPSCLTRNETTRVLIQGERTLAAIETDELVSDAHRDTANSLEGLLVNCNQYLHPEPKESKK